MAKLKLNELSGRINRIEDIIENTPPAEVVEGEIHTKNERKRSTKIINMLLKESDCIRIHDLAYTLGMTKSRVFSDLIKYARYLLRYNSEMFRDEIRKIVRSNEYSTTGRKITYSVRPEIINDMDIIKRRTRRYIHDIITATIDIFIEENNIEIISNPKELNKIKTYRLIRSDYRHDKSNTRIK